MIIYIIYRARCNLLFINYLYLNDPPFGIFVPLPTPDIYPSYPGYLSLEPRIRVDVPNLIVGFRLEVDRTGSVFSGAERDALASLLQSDFGKEKKLADVRKVRAH